MKTVDVAIIGAGTAGLTARRAAEKNGAKPVLIDPGPLGTTCARVGCMPSKLLIAAAEVAHQARNGETFGVDTKVAIDGERVMARVQAERDRFTGFVLKTTERVEQEGGLLRGRARFIEPGVLDIEGTRLGYERAIIAAGTTPFVPPPYRGVRDAVLTNEHIFEMKTLPESLLVVGLGVIGLELGQAMARLGVRVTLVGIGGNIAGVSDPVVRDVALQTFAKELDLHPDHTLHSVESDPGGVRIHFTDSQGAERRETFEKVLVAAGRRSNLTTLDVEAAGVELGPKGEVAFDPNTLQIKGHPLFIAGDITGDRALLHEAANEGRIAGENAANWPNVLWHRRATSLGITFSDPNIAIVGPGYNEVRRVDHAVGAVDYSDQGRARVMAQNQGLVHIYADKVSGRLLGAEMVGPRVEHTAHLLAWAVEKGVTVTEALQMPFYHPVVEEGIRTALRNLQTNLHMAPKIGRPCEEWGPGD